MLGTHDAVATIAVRDLNAAKRFYEGTLGLERDAEAAADPPVYRSGATRILVYPSPHSGTNRATAATWFVKDIERVVEGLKDRGVSFEHYDLKDTLRQGDVHVSGSRKAAWFKDPDGNILGLVSG